MNAVPQGLRVIRGLWVPREPEATPDVPALRGTEANRVLWVPRVFPEFPVQEGQGVIPDR